MASVKVNLEPLKRFVSILANDLRGSGFGPIRKVMKKWAARYRSSVRRRFVKMSKGGWPKLKHKRKRGARSSALILRDTGNLLAALAIKFTGKPGALEKTIPFGIRVGYGGSGVHPTDGRITVARLAQIHQSGLGKGNPKREIIVGTNELSPSPIPGMVTDMERGLKELANNTGN